MKHYKAVCILILSNFLISITCHNKYTKQANEDNKISKNDEEPVDLRPISLKHLDRPFRMAKLNLLWSKAVLRLSEVKLKSIFGELKLHDKEEITWKHLRAEGKDKDGTMEAKLRQKLLQIMENYGLLDQAEDMADVEKVKRWKPLNEASDKHINKSLFKDKKLNKLWEKAERAGFTMEELLALREEFSHHQDKIDQYYALLHDVKETPQDYEGNAVEDSLDKFNKIQLEEEEPKKDYLDRINLIREKHKDINDGFDRLHLISAKGPASKEFVEPKVQGLWKIAVESNFTPAELHSLRTELLHYENRLLKLRHLQVEHALHEEKYKEKEKMGIAGGKTDKQSLMSDNIKKHARKVEKIHLDIETRIMQKHIEL